MNTKKPKSHSKGFLGGLLSIGGFGVLVMVLNSLGVPVEKDELKSTHEAAGTILLQVDHIKSVIWPAVVGLGAAVVGLIGNLRRKTKLAWSSRNGKNPLASNGVMGNVGGAIAGVVSVFTVLSSELSPDALQLIGEQVSVLKVQLSDLWKIIAPAVTAIVGTIVGVLGRMQAKERITGNTIDIPAGVLLAPLAAVLLFPSCSSVKAPAIGLEANQSPEGDSRGCFRLFGIGPVDLTICADKANETSPPPVVVLEETEIPVLVPEHSK